MRPPRHYREQAEHARCLASVTYQLALKDELRRVAGEFDEIAHDLETGAFDLEPSRADA